MIWLTSIVILINTSLVVPVLGISALMYALPTSMTDKFSPTNFLLAQIAAVEERGVTIIDISSAFLNAHMPKTGPTNLLFIGISEEVRKIIKDLDDSSSSYIQPDGTPVFELDGALYGCIESALFQFQELQAVIF